MENPTLHHDRGKPFPFLIIMSQVIYMLSNNILQADEKRIIKGIVFSLTVFKAPDYPET